MESWAGITYNGPSLPTHTRKTIIELEHVRVIKQDFVVPAFWFRPECRAFSHRCLEARGSVDWD